MFRISGGHSIGFLRILFPVICLVLGGCTEEVDLYTASQPTPIVYCLLDPNSSTQFVRLSRTFKASPGGIDNPPEADSTVWKVDHDVYIEEYENETRGQTFSFTGDTSIIKDTGFFPTNNLRVYRAQFTPKPGSWYRLYVYFPDLDKMVSGKTMVHGDPTVLDPIPISVRKISFIEGQPFTARWLPGAYSGVYQLVFRIHYLDSTALDQSFHFADYSSGGIFNLQTDQMVEYSIGGVSFFEAMAKGVPKIEGVRREVISIEFIMISGGEDLGFLFRSEHETGTTFSNLSGYSNLRNGIGVFASRTETHIPNLTLSEVTLDQLAKGNITKHLGFKDSHGK